MPPKSLSRLFRVDEMANTRKGPTWAVLDWAAQQTGEFSLKDLFAVYQKAGGEQGYTSFHTTIGHMTAKPWKDDQEKYGLSEDRPFAIAKRGSRGAGGATSLYWGLEAPLREPPEGMEAELGDDGGGDEEGTGAIGDALDRLEALMGRDKLKAALARWRGMKSIHQAVADIRGTVPPKGQMDALHVASDALVSAGRADDSEEAEAELSSTALTKKSPVAPDGPGAASQHTNPPPVNPAPTAMSSQSSADDDDDGEEDEPAPPARPVASPMAAPPKKHTGWGKKR